MSFTIALIVSNVPNEKANALLKYMPNNFHWSGCPPFIHFFNSSCTELVILRRGTLLLATFVSFNGGKNRSHVLLTSKCFGIALTTSVCKYARLDSYSAFTRSFFNTNFVNIRWIRFSMTPFFLLIVFHGMVFLSSFIFRNIQLMYSTVPIAPESSLNGYPSNVLTQSPNVRRGTNEGTIV